LREKVTVTAVGTLDDMIENNVQLARLDGQVMTCLDLADLEFSDVRNFYGIGDSDE